MSSGIRGAGLRERRDEVRQQVRRDGVDDAEAQRPFERIPALRATVLTRAASSSARRACATISAPIGVTSTSPLPRSKICTPSSSSRFFTAAERLGWLTKQRSAARPKWRSAATATTYLSSVSVIGKAAVQAPIGCAYRHRY